VRRALVGSSVAWALMLPLATFAAAQAQSAHAWSAVALVVYAAGHVICHQLPGRSFHLWAQQMPVCARCTGLYFGASVAAIAAGVMGLRPNSGSAGFASNPHRARVILLLAALPTISTLVYEWTTGDMPANAVRAAAGFPLGAAVAWLIVRA
jgi:uncharacterized membrane protein